MARPRPTGSTAKSQKGSVDRVVAEPVDSVLWDLTGQDRIPTPGRNRSVESVQARTQPWSNHYYRRPQPRDCQDQDAARSGNAGDPDLPSLNVLTWRLWCFLMFRIRRTSCGLTTASSTASTQDLRDARGEPKSQHGYFEAKVPADLNSFAVQELNDTL